MGIGKQQQENNPHEWTEQGKACRESGMTVGAWCEKNSINQSTYYRRKRMVAAMAGDGVPSPLESRSPECNMPAFAEYELPTISSSGVIKLHFICLRNKHGINAVGLEDTEVSVHIVLVKQSKICYN